jgi:dimethylhistidine N-methyltransferase
MMTRNPRGTLPGTREGARSHGTARETFLHDVLDGLRQPEKSIPSKYFYDANGSALFERICDLDEYYLTRAEIGIMRAKATEIASAIPPAGILVEFGSGASLKTRVLLDHAPDIALYVPVDISEGALGPAARDLSVDYPDLAIEPVRADFMSDFLLPASARHAERRIGYFPGSTIGNLVPTEAIAFLRRALQIFGQGAGLIVGIDLVKDRHVMESAYNDRKGVTAAFNLNILNRINHELGADFNPALFDHFAFYNPMEDRIEMHLVSGIDHEVTVGGEHFLFEAGETIRTEYSYKYSIEGFERLARAAGFRVDRVWTDPRRYFSVQRLVARA